MRQSEKKRRAPRDENPFMRLCYNCMSAFGTVELEIDEAMWWLKWRQDEIDEIRIK